MTIVLFYAYKAVKIILFFIIMKEEEMNAWETILHGRGKKFERKSVSKMKFGKRENQEKTPSLT